jgi:hypothetical protein
MADTLTSDQRSYRVSMVKSKDTSPKKTVHSERQAARQRLRP